LESRISRIRLSHQELWSLIDRRPNPAISLSSKEDGDSRLVLIEFEPGQFRSLARISLLLDRIILFIEPEVESLREAYRLMKIFWGLNREIEFMLLFRTRLTEEKKEVLLFERFSLITSRFLGISPGWLGELALPERNDAFENAPEASSNFNFRTLLSSEGLHRPLSPEKIRFWEELQKMSSSYFSAEGVCR
jgi:hypothetical protein